MLGNELTNVNKLEFATHVFLSSSLKHTHRSADIMRVEIWSPTSFNIQPDQKSRSEREKERDIQKESAREKNSLFTRCTTVQMISHDTH